MDMQTGISTGSSQVSIQTAHLKRNMSFEHSGFCCEFWWLFRVSCFTCRATKLAPDPPAVSKHALAWFWSCSVTAFPPLPTPLPPSAATWKSHGATRRQLLLRLPIVEFLESQVATKHTTLNDDRADFWEIYASIATHGPACKTACNFRFWGNDMSRDRRDVRALLTQDILLGWLRVYGLMGFVCVHCV